MMNLKTNKTVTAEGIIKTLGLSPLLPEGGFFKRTFESAYLIPFAGAQRPSISSIYYLVTPDSFSKLHKLTTDEIYHFYLGDPLELHTVDVNGNHLKHILGPDLLNGHVPQVAVPINSWQCSKMHSNIFGYSLVGTTVSPGFEIKDFTLGTEEDLKQFKSESRATLAKFLE